jgi:hypothetical protein
LLIHLDTNMLKINPKPTFTWPAQITVPGADKPGDIEITWRYKTRSELATWLRGRPVRDATQDDNDQVLAAEAQADAQWLGEVVVGWNGPVDDDGQPVVYSTSALGNLLNTHARAGSELLSSYLRAMTESRAKN